MSSVNISSRSSGSIKSVDSNTDKKSPTRPYLIALIIFIVLAVILIILALWWFLWRDVDNPLVRVCTTSNQCLPSEICKDGTCNAVTCSVNSECSVVAGGNGAAYCISGYCQSATCNDNTDCSVTGGTQICTHFTPNIATPWINSMCVNPGGTCTSNLDCYGGEVGLICVKQEGQTTGVCSQCGTRSDCPTGQICSSGVCTECTDPTQCDTTTGETCNNGLCCANPQYSVNSTQGVLNSCVQGGLYDICVNNGDCSTGKCLDLGNNVKICGGGTQGNMTFSAGTVVTVGDPAKVALYRCSAPVDPSDTSAKPFAVDGVCAYYSSSNAAQGSACGRPSFCTQVAKSSNLLCNGNIIFNNPFAQACSSNADCTASGTGCSNAGYCSKTCSTNPDCPAGFVCGSNKICQYPTSQLVCTANNCLGSNWANTCECPSGYMCNAKAGSTGNCVWQDTGDDPNDPIPPPPPFVITSVCSRPATALPSGSNIATTNYCVNGFCSSNAGWVNSICEGDGDCLYIDGNSSTNVRTSLVCTNIGTYSVCRGGSNNSVSR